MNPTGSMKTFFRFRARKAARGREEIQAFWERRGVVFGYRGSACPAASLEASSSSPDTLEDQVAEREYAELMAANASDEELLAWATWREEWDFVDRKSVV